MKSTYATSRDTFISNRIVPIISCAARDENINENDKKIDWPLGLAFFGFIVAFSMVRYLLPDNLIGNIFTFISFPILFLASLALVAFIYRQRLAEIFAKMQERFLIRTRAMHAMADQFDLDYIPLPGGPAQALKMLSSWRFCPQIIKDIHEVMDAHGGFDDVSEIIRASGLAVPREIVIASKETKGKYHAQQANMQQLEDGFKGIRNGMPFAALVWAEDCDETKIHHFIIALKIPKRLTGHVEFKTRKATWPVNSPNLNFKTVKLVSSDFKRNFEVRATDQMESRLVFDPAVIERLTDYSEAKIAVQASEKKVIIRGSVFDDNLVVDFIGDKRFDLLDLSSGEWNLARIHRTMDDIKDMLTLVDGVTAVFSGPPKSAISPSSQENAA